MNKNGTAGFLILRSAISMAVIIAVAYLFNFAPEKVGILRSATDLDTFTPMLAPEFAEYLPGLNLWWGLSFTFHVAMLVTRRWTPALRWAQMALGFIGAFVLARIALRDPFLTSPESVFVRYLLASAALTLIFSSARSWKIPKPSSLEANQRLLAD